MSINVIFSRIGASMQLASNLDRNPVPIEARDPKGRFVCSASAFPGIVFSSLACTTAMKRSVVGSGPVKSAQCSSIDVVALCKSAPMWRHSSDVS